LAAAQRRQEPTVFRRLCDLAFSSQQLFPRLADIVTELAAKVFDQHLILTNLQDEDSVVMTQHPKQVLALLSVILPEEVSKGPYALRAF
jgi:hypothetical protein